MWCLDQSLALIPEVGRHVVDDNPHNVGAIVRRCDGRKEERERKAKQRNSHRQVRNLRTVDIRGGGHEGRLNGASGLLQANAGGLLQTANYPV